MLTRKQKLRNTSAAAAGSTLSLLDINFDNIACVLSSETMRCPDGARGLGLMACACRMIGLKGQLDGKGRDSREPAMAAGLAQIMCKALGVKSLPVTLGSGWCWPRMLAWASEAVRVSPNPVRGECKTIREGIRSSCQKQKQLASSGVRAAEGCVLCLVEPGVYEEAICLSDHAHYDEMAYSNYNNAAVFNLCPGSRVSIWASERESTLKEGKLQVEWRSKDGDTLCVCGDVSINVRGLQMSAQGAENWDPHDESFVCVHALERSEIMLEQCSLRSDLEDIVMVQDGAVGLFFECNITQHLLDELTLQQMLSYGYRPGMNPWAAAVVVQDAGEISMKKCTFSSLTGAGVHIRGKGSEAMLSGNRIHHGKAQGVIICTEGKAIMEDNEIFSNAAVGVVVAGEGSKAELRGNRIYSGKDGGVLVSSKGSATLDDNDIHSNKSAGVAVQGEGSKAVLSGNRIHKGSHAGVFVIDKGSATLEDNDIHSNAYSGVVVKGGQVILNGNRIHDGKHAGVMIDRSHSSESEGKATLTNNAIFSNVLSGVHIVAGSTAKLCKNSIHGNKRHGVTVLGINSQSEAAQLEENEIHSNIFGGVHIKGPGARAVVLSNRIFGNKGGGVIIKAKAKATLERNDILSSSSCNGVSILGGSDAILRSNRIYGSKRFYDGQNVIGVLVVKSVATLENNEIHSNTCGVEVRSGRSRTVLKGNRVHDNNENGIYIHGHTDALLEDNDVYANSLSGVVVEDEGSKAALRNNRVHDGQQDGVLICYGAKATLDDNVISRNWLSGVNVDYSGSVRFASNIIKNNGQCMLERTEGSIAGWSADDWSAAGRAGGISGVSVSNHSTVALASSSNDIEGNGSTGDAIEVKVDDTSSLFRLI